MDGAGIRGFWAPSSLQDEPSPELAGQFVWVAEGEDAPELQNKPVEEETRHKKEAQAIAHHSAATPTNTGHAFVRFRDISQESPYGSALSRRLPATHSVLWAGWDVGLMLMAHSLLLKQSSLFLYEQRRVQL